MPITTCPDRESLARYVIGKLTVEELETFSDHVDGCPACQSTVEGLDGLSDTVLSELRQPASEETVENERACQEMVARALASGPAATDADRALTADGSTPAVQARAPETTTALPHEPLQELIGRYRILEQLGRGGMGTVYKAHDPQLDRVVALKVPRFDISERQRAVAVQRFMREARAAAKIRHPHVCTIYDVGEHEGSPYVVMAYVEGQSLDERLHGQRRFEDPAEAVTLARQVAEALEAVHSHGIIHRDLKPGNILIDSAGRAVLTDFGLARPENDTEHLTLDGAIVGTPAFMAPEQASGDADEIGPWTDLYSLGVVLYRMLTGKMPFEGQALVLLNKIVHEPAPTPSSVRPGLDPTLDAICLKAMAKRPGDRYQSASQIAAALDQFLRPAPPAVRVLPLSVGWDESASLNSPRRAGVATKMVGLEDSSHPTKLPWRWITAAAAVLLAAAGLYFAPQVIRIVTNKGQIVIETDGAGIEVVIKDGLGKVLDTETKREITFKAGEYNIEVTVKDSGGEQRFVTDHFTLTRNGKKTVDARWEVAKAKLTTAPGSLATDPPAIPASTDPDRRAAEWVLSIGGEIKIKENGKERQTEAVRDLPRWAFELTTVNLASVKASDAGLAHFRGCTNLKVLNLNSTQVSDAGLAHFKDCKGLTVLSLQNTSVSDMGLAHFKDCKDLTVLNLAGVNVSDAGLAHFEDCKNLTYLRVNGTQVSDAGLAHFKHCKNLRLLDLSGTRVSDAGLAHFEGCKNLTHLDVYNLRVSDAGLAHFKDCKNFTYLNLGGTEVSDAGLVHFKDCTHLTHLNLRCRNVSDAGLVHFQDCKNLTDLSLGATQVSDAGLAHFQDCKNLTGLHLDGTNVSDAGLAHFKDCKDLTVLDLRETPVSDAGLAHFKDCKKLTRLYLESTQVSDAGLADLAILPRLIELTLANTRISLHGHEQLKTAMPKCQITWSETNRSVAESVLALGGTVEIGTLDKPESRPIQAAADLPAEYFQVRRVSLADVAKPLDKLPEQLSWLRFPEFDRMESIDLSGIKLSNYGFLAPIHGLRELSLANAGLNDDKLADLPKLPALTRMVLDGNEIRGLGLAYLSRKPELIDLSLGCPNLTDVLAKNLAELKQVKRLSLAGSGLSDAGIKHLAGLTNLESLDLRRTKASAAGIAELQKALPNCQIVWDGAESESGNK